MSIVLIAIGIILFYFGKKSRPAGQGKTLMQTGQEILHKETGAAIGQAFGIGFKMYAKIMMLVVGGMLVFFGLMGLLFF